MGVIKREPSPKLKRTPDAKVVRQEEPKHFRFENEVQNAAEMGRIGRNVKEWYKDIYNTYQDNEV